MKPYKCPVCDGTGKVSRPSYLAGDLQEWSGSSSGPFSCQACVGSGIVWKQDAIAVVYKVPKNTVDCVQYTCIHGIVGFCDQCAHEIYFNKWEDFLY